MKKIDKIHNISWDGKHTFKITSICGEINAEVIFYNPVDDRNKATGKGSRKYNYGLMLSCYEYKNAKIETEFGLPYGTLGSVEKVTEIFNKYSEMEVNRITSWHGAQLLQSEFEKYTFGQKREYIEKCYRDML